MSEVTEIISRAREIRARLLNPPNAVKDTGIDLHPPRIPPKEEIKPEVIEYSQIKVTLTEIKRAPPRRASISAIIKAVADHYNVRVSDIAGKCRTIPIAKYRHICCYLASLHSGKSLSMIGRSLNLHHTSIMHGRDKIRELILVDSVLLENISLLEQKIFSGMYD